MFQIHTSMSNSTTSLSEEQSVSSASGTRIQDFVGCLNPLLLQPQQQQHTSFNNIPTTTTTTTPTPTQFQPRKVKKKRSLPGNPDPDAEVIALSPKTLLATNRFICEICNKGFQRDQNLQLHRRGHNLPWKLKQRPTGPGLIVKKKAYVCPEPSCVHHLPSRALGDLTGIKKHFCRKHGEKKFKCDKCSKTYAVYSDWKAHSKTCGTREYTCDCGTIFSRKDSFITHRAFCDALAEESARLSANNPSLQSFSLLPHTHHHHHHDTPLFPNLSSSTQNFPNNIHVIPPQQTPHISLTDPWDTIPPPHHHHHHQNPNDQHHYLVKPELSSPSSLFPPPLAGPQNPLTSAAAAASSHNKSLLAPTFNSLRVSTTQPAGSGATSAAHLSATALLQKACKVGIASGHKAIHDTTSRGHRHVTYNLSSNDMIDDQQLEGGQLFGGHVVTGCATVTPDHEYMASLTAATPSSQELTAGWQKCDGLTRDFLGLTGHEEGCRYGGGGGGGRVHVGINMQGLLKFSTSGGQAQTGFAAAAAAGDDTNNTSATVYERGDHHSSLLSGTHHHVFGSAEPRASDNWGHC